MNKRQDLVLAEAFVNKRWIIDYNVRDKDVGANYAGPNYPYFPLSFKKQNKVCWKCSRGWAVATITSFPEHYTAHRYYSDLSEVLEKES